MNGVRTEPLVLSAASWASLPARPLAMAHLDPTLETLMERYADGDARAFDQLYAQLERPLRGALRRWISQDDRIEDALQQSLLKLHASRGRYVRGAPVLPWVLTIARNVAIDVLRSVTAKKEQPLDDAKVATLADEREPPHLDHDEEAVIAAVREAIEALPPSAREVVRLHKLEGKTMAEISGLLGIREGAARVRAHRGYRALAEKLAQLRDDLLSPDRPRGGGAP